MCAFAEASSVSGRPRSRAAFSLVEMLVAFGVLSLLVILMVQLWSAASASALEGKRQIDNYSKSRSTMDAFARDVKSGVFRRDLGAFVDESGAGAICFYTQRPGVGTKIRNVSLVVYELEPAKALLKRGAMPLAWSDPASSISFANTNSLPMVAGVAPEDVAVGVLRMGLTFTDASGAVTRAYSTNSRAVGVTLAMVDENTLRLLSAEQLERLTSTNQDLPDDPNPTQSLKAFWESKLAAPGFFDNYPASLRSGLRIFERHVVLPVQ